MPIWPRSGHAAVVSATFTMTSPSGLTVDLVDHAEVDDRGVELGVEHAREHAADVVARLGRRRRSVGGRVRSVRLDRAGRRGARMWSLPNKTSVDLENMPDLRGTVKAMDLLAMLKALGDETRFSMYRELAGSTRGCYRARARRSLGLHANTVRLHLDRLREAGLVEVEPVHRGTVGRPHPRLFAGAGRARPRVSIRPATRCSPACSPRSPNGSAPTARRPPRSAGPGAPRPAGGPDSHSCVKALVAEMSRLGFEPVTETAGADDRHGVHALPVPRAGRGLSRAGLQSPPGDLARGSSNEVGGGSGRGVRDVVRP